MLCGELFGGDWRYSQAFSRFEHPINSPNSLDTWGSGE